MRKKIAVIGLVILIVGIALAVGGIQEDKSLVHTTVKTDPYNTTTTGYMTDNITVSHGYEVLVISSDTHSGLIKASNLPKADNITNLEHYEITPTSHASDEMIYTGLPAGTYVFIAFNTSMPVITYEYASLTTMEIGGSLLVIGGIAAFVGFIILIIGLVLKKKKPENPVEDTFNMQ